MKKNAQPSLFASLKSVVLMLVITAAALGIYHVVWGGPSIAVVRSAQVVEEYKGFEEVNRFLQQRRQTMQSELDSLRSNSPSDAQLVYRKAADFDAAFQEESNRLNQTVLDKINVFTAGYAAKKGYDIVLGTTLSGSVLHAEPAYDITEELIKALNDDYDHDQ